MKLFVTGGSGFIGRHLVRQLLADGHEIVSAQGRKRGAVLPDGVMAVQFPGQAQAAAEFFRQNCFDGVIHLATRFLGGEPAPEEAEELILDNVLFSGRVLAAAVAGGVKWFLNLGTYWQSFDGKTSDPVNFYAATKQAFEDIASSYWKLGRIRYASLYICDTYGRGDTRPKIFNLWEKLRREGGTLAMSAGAQRLNLLHVDDVVSGIVLLAGKLDAGEVPPGSRFKLESDELLTLRELAGRFETVSGCRLDIRWGKRSYRPREVMDPAFPAPKLPGWRQTVGLDAGIRDLLGMTGERDDV